MHAPGSRLGVHPEGPAAATRSPPATSSGPPGGASPSPAARCPCSWERIYLQRTHVQLAGADVNPEPAVMAAMAHGPTDVFWYMDARAAMGLRRPARTPTRARAYSIRAGGVGVTRSVNIL